MEAVFDILERLLREGVLNDYAIGGATAAGIHGEPLATRDIDVFVLIEPPPGALLVTLAPIFRRLAELGFDRFEEEGILVYDFPVQFLSASPGLESEAVTHAVVKEWDSHRVKLIRAEHLAALALKTGRSKDRARLAILLEIPDFNSPGFLEILARHNLGNCWDEWAAALDLSLR